jgi:hypothetical protein
MAPGQKTEEQQRKRTLEQATVTEESEILSHNLRKSYMLEKLRNNLNDPEGMAESMKC